MLTIKEQKQLKRLKVMLSFHKGDDIKIKSIKKQIRNLIMKINN